MRRGKNCALHQERSVCAGCFRGSRRKGCKTNRSLGGPDETHEDAVTALLGRKMARTDLAGACHRVWPYPFRQGALCMRGDAPDKRISRAVLLSARRRLLERISS